MTIDALVEDEAGPVTLQALQTLMLGLENAKIDEARSLQQVKDKLEPKVLSLAPTGTTSNQPLSNASIVHFTGATSFDLTGFLAPEPGKSRVLILHNSGTGTITLKHEVTSSSANQLSLISGADTTKAQRTSAMFVYLTSKWRQVV
jgi:hypothetical protein